MTKFKRDLLIAAAPALVGVGVFMWHGAADAAVDDGPCPAGTYGWLPPGADYADGVWSVGGTPFGTGAYEDSCWAPVAVVFTQMPPPQTLPVTL